MDPCTLPPKEGDLAPANMCSGDCLPCLLPAEVLHFASRSLFLSARWMQLIHESLNQANPDYNVLMVDMAIFTTFGLLAGILLDLSYGFIDPRIRMGAKK